MKKCIKCLETKELTEFYACKKARDGKHSYCISCHKLSRKQHDEAYYRSLHEKNNVESKTCTKCGVTQSIENFSRMLKTFDGYRPDCKACHNKVKLSHARV